MQKSTKTYNIYCIFKVLKRSHRCKPILSIVANTHTWQQNPPGIKKMEQADPQTDAAKTRHPNAAIRRSDHMFKKFCHDNAEYAQGYHNAQHDLFWFIVALGVVCVIGGVVVGMCV